MTSLEHLSVEILEKPNDVLKHLHLGINIPIRDEFYEFLFHDIDVYHAKSLVLKEDNKVVAHTLAYDDGGEVLFFGFFGVIDHEEKRIEFLIKELISFAQKHQYKKIRGPINPPTFIYGWGFMAGESSKDLLVSNPVNPPIYQDIFSKQGFYLKSKQGTWEGEVFIFPEEKIKNFDLESYEVHSLKEWDDLHALKLTLMILSARNLASGSRITPSPEKLFDNFFSFLKKYGKIYMVKLLRHKPSKQFVGCFIGLPNPFSKNSKGKYNSFVAYSITIDKEHRNKGLSMFLTKEVYDAAYNDGIRYMSGPMEASVVECKNLGIKHFGLTYTRTHLILERKVE